MSSYLSPKEGVCARSGCFYQGEVRINSEYEYLCPDHMTLYVKSMRWSSARGKVVYTASKIRNLRAELAELLEALPEARRAEIVANQEFHAALKALQDR